MAHRSTTPRPAHGETPAAFRRIWDHARAEQLWHAHRAAPTGETRERLIEFLLPLAFITAHFWWRWLLYKLPAAPTFGDLLSDCTLGLVKAVDEERERNRPIGWVRQVMKRHVMRAMAERDWSYSARRRRAANKRQTVLRDFRRRVARQEGRVATKAEMTAHLATLIDNPLLTIGDAAPPMLSLSDDVYEDVKYQHAAPDRVSPELHNTHALRLAMRDLDAEDRRLLKMILRGESTAGIAATLGVKPKAARRRANGLLWVLGRRQDLAGALGQVPLAERPKASRRASIPCAGCGNTYQPRGPGSHKFCSEACRDAAGWQSKVRAKPIEPRRCAECEEPFVPKNNKARFCSDRCRRAAHWRLRTARLTA